MSQTEGRGGVRVEGDLSLLESTEGGICGRADVTGPAMDGCAGGGAVGCVGGAAMGGAVGIVEAAPGVLVAALANAKLSTRIRAS